MTRYVTVEPAADDVALVRIDRPPANALDLDLLHESDTVFAELAAADPAAVVLTGRPGFFSAGVDLKVAPTLDADGQRALVAGINRLFAGWYAHERPVVCAVNGHAIAGGTILALCGDRRIGCAQGKLGLTELRVGLGFPAVAIAVVRAELTPAAARQLVLGTELVDPAAAAALGVLDEVVDGDDPLPRAFEVARELAALPRAAYPRVKRQLREPALAEIERVLAGDADPIARDWVGTDTADAASGILGGGKGA